MSDQNQVIYVGWASSKTSSKVCLTMYNHFWLTWHKANLKNW